jgi:hypothetical protein
MEKSTQRSIHPEADVQPKSSTTHCTFHRPNQISFLERSEINLELLLSLGNSLHTKGKKILKTKGKLAGGFGFNTPDELTAIAIPPIDPPDYATANKRERCRSKRCGWLFDTQHESCSILGKTLYW